MKKLFAIALSVLLLAGCASTPKECPPCATPDASEPTTAAPAPLPEPRDTTKTYKPSKDAADEACTAEVWATGCSSINVDNLTEYLGRDDVLYIDLRDYNDYAKKHLRNFEVIPYFALIFDEAAGTEGKPQLYGGTLDAPVATYEESAALLEAMFPKDKTIFLMCQSGGRVAQMMKLMNSLGYDMSKVYNVGGMGQFTDSKFAPYTTDTAEIVLEATYSFEGLTPATK